MIKKKEHNLCPPKRADTKLTCGSCPLSKLSQDGLTPGLLDAEHEPQTYVDPSEEKMRGRMSVLLLLSAQVE